MVDYKTKYKKYKEKYLTLRSQSAGITIPKYTSNVSEPWFTLILLGLKTVEGRKNKGMFKEMRVGDVVKWTNDNFGDRSVMTKVVRKAEYNTFKEYLETEGLDKCLPGITNLEHGLNVYYKYFTKEDEKEFGVIAIEVEKIDL